MYGPPMTDSEDEFEYEGYCFGGGSYSNSEPRKPPRDIHEEMRCAIQNCNLPELKKLIEESYFDLTKPLDYNDYLLTIACRSGNLEIVTFLLDNGASPNKSNDCSSNLAVACSRVEPNEEVLEIVKALLDADAVVNVSDRYGVTPFMLACERGHEDVVKLLLKQVSFEACDNQGCTALFYAIQNNQPNIVKILLDHGFATDITNNRGYTPLQVAQYLGYDEIQDMLPKMEEPGYTAPLSFLTYKSICDMIPRVFPESEIPEYFPDVNMILTKVGLDFAVDCFAKNRISLAEFLVMDDEKLKATGFELPIHRKKIIACLINFQLNQWTKRSIARVQRDSTESFYDILVLSGNHLQNVIIINSALQYVLNNLDADILGTVSEGVLKQLKQSLKAYRKTIKDITRTVKYLHSFSPERPPLFIDYDEYVHEKRRKKFRKVFKYTLLAAITAVIWYKVPRIL